MMRNISLGRKRKPGGKKYSSPGMAVRVGFTIRPVAV
jgi:hypothetical protein